MRRVLVILAALVMLTGCKDMKMSKTMLKALVSVATKEKTTPCYADSCEKRIGLPYVQNGDPAQVLDI